MNQIHYQDWGMIPYQTAWEKQKKIQEEMIFAKENHCSLPHQVIFCQHPATYTLGSKTLEESFQQLSKDFLKEKKADLIVTDRGGGVTFHGRGQLVVYFIFDLEKLNKDLHLFLRNLEEVVLLILKDCNLEGFRLPDFTGVWIDQQNPRKIAALGIRCKKWVTLHGFALNIDPDLSFFDFIIPCNIADKGVTSLKKEGITVDPSALKEGIKAKINYLWDLVEI